MTAISRDGEYVVLQLSSDERRVLTGFVTNVAELLAPDPSDDLGIPTDPLAEMVGISDLAPTARPDDPAVARLLPDAYASDEDAAEFRRLTDAGLRSEKMAALNVVLAGIADARDGNVRMTRDELDLWLTALNDVRLVLGVRLDVTEDRDEREGLAASDPRTPLFVAYDWLSFMQEALIEQIDPLA